MKRSSFLKNLFGIIAIPAILKELKTDPSAIKVDAKQGTGTNRLTFTQRLHGLRSGDVIMTDLGSQCAVVSVFEDEATIMSTNGQSIKINKSFRKYEVTS